LKTKTKTTKYGIENLGPGLGQTQKCGSIKPVNGISTFPLLEVGDLLKVVQFIYRQHNKMGTLKYK
jgi:hypothetical protein